MPAIWPQPFALKASHLGRLGEMHLDTTACEFRHVRRSGLAFGAGEGRPDSRRTVEAQYRDQMEIGGPARCRDRPLGDPVFPQARQFLRERDMSFEIIFVESGEIVRS